MITLSMLLKSWATPPASLPIASIFWDCSNWAWVDCSSSRLRRRSSSRRALFQAAAIWLAKAVIAGTSASVRSSACTLSRPIRVGSTHSGQTIDRRMPRASAARRMPSRISAG